MTSRDELAAMRAKAARWTLEDAAAHPDPDQAQLLEMAADDLLPLAPGEDKAEQ